MNAYYESAEELTITRARAIKELQDHNIPEEDMEFFFADLGDHDTYAAQDVLDWLGH